MIYLDNAATTNHKPLSVKLSVLKAMSKKYSANPGRSSHPISINAALKILQAREKIANYFNLENSNNVIFTSGCTESLNLAILGSVKTGGHIITTIYEHNSVLRPLSYLKEKNLIDYTVVKPNFYGEITKKELQNAIQPNTYMLIVNHISNVTGYEINLEECSSFCEEHNLKLLVDAAQSGGHKQIDMQKNNINLLCLAGHKGFFAPQGVGVLLFQNITLNPIKFGGTGLFSESANMPLISPEAYEVGTTCTPNIFGFLAGLEFVRKHFCKIIKKQKELTEFLLREFKKIKELQVYTKDTFLNGVVSFNIKNLPSQQVANELSDKRICVRSGLHCAPLLHKHFGTSEQGMVRVSFSYFTTKKQLQKLIIAINQIIKNN
ncbi:MAG: cysteine desulfurase [Tenericutes bacterium HGW-Tenericutes-4]|nr:MAG: cysteine desulfurase [Tenericutes bacterium HGW-Tenericutes-4]